MELYLSENSISYSKLDTNLFLIEKDRYLLIEPKKGLLFDEDFNLILSESEEAISTDFYTFKFGGRYYFTETVTSPDLKPLKFLGKYKPTLGFNYPFLGIHGGYELLNGSRLYEDWVKKASFLEIKSLGICEKNTLAGAFLFQKACDAADIKSIIGEEIIVRDDTDHQFSVKLYVKSAKAWGKLISINREINTINGGFIRYRDFLKYISEGDFFIVLDPKGIDYDKAFPIELNEECYYQLDPVEFSSNERDASYLKNLKRFVRSHIPPIAISDAYYLDKEDAHIKKQLNMIANKYDYDSKDQYFRSVDQYFEDVMKLFSAEDETAVNIFMAAIDNANKLARGVDFKIPTGERHLPVYRMKDSESQFFENNEALFWDIIQKGIEEKVSPEKIDYYIDRIQHEFEVIQSGGVLDYFLILWDIVNWAKENDIAVGIARGSAGGALISMLMGITHIDPIEFDLLFERFLNPGRVLVSMPDIDVDFEASKRGLVKEYIELRYGKDYVCSVGTYTTFQIKGVIKDFARISNAEFKDANIITKKMTGEETFSDMFKNAVSDKMLKSFIVKYPEVINAIPLVFKQPKAASIHPCAMIISPRNYPVINTIPLRLHDSEIVSEWEGSELESAGFLKEDILGIKQLDKIADIVRLIKQNHGHTIDIYNIDKDDEKVYMRFCNGHNSDVFHFGSKGLTGYCRQLKPKTIHDLIAGIALYRPGAMESNFHNEYVKRKNGDSRVEYLWGTQHITEETYGLFCYQEQVMKAVVDIGGFSLSDADNVRKAMGKKDKKLLDSYMNGFIQYAINQGCGKDIAIDIWSKLEKFAEYGFNKSHAAAYALTGYISQWLKVNYPIEFWTTAFKYAKDDEFPLYMSEIHYAGDIKIVPPDINISGKHVSPNFKTNSIHWGFLSIRDLGEVAVTQILEIRDSIGAYFSFEDFVQRNFFKNSKVDKRTVENLVMSGAFDGIENIDSITERLKLIETYNTITKRKVKEGIFIDDAVFLKEDWWWNLQQKRLCGVAFFEYQTLCDNLNTPEYDFYEVEEIKKWGDNIMSTKVTIAGYVIDVIVRDSKKGEYADILIESNYNFIYIKIWAEKWIHLKSILKEGEKKILIINGIADWDSYRSDIMITACEETKCLLMG